MTGQTLMLHASLEATRPGAGTAAFAVSAAAALGGHLNVIAPHVDVAAPTSWEGRSADELARAVSARRMELAALVETITAGATAAGVRVSSKTEWAHPFGPIPFIADEAKLHDLVITGVDQSVILSERKIAEHVLFESGRPIVIVPQDYRPPFSCKKVTVAWDHTRTAARALHDALPFLRLAEQVMLVAVGGEKRFQTNPDPATIEEALARKGLNGSFMQIELGERTIGQALQGHALENGADLLVMGGFGHSRLRNFILGGATREVLDHPHLPVLMSH